jgi:hypothetical protein
MTRRGAWTRHRRAPVGFECYAFGRRSR